MLWLKWCGLILMGVGLSFVGFWMAYKMDRRLIEYRQLQKVLMILSGRMQIGESLESALESCILAGAGAWEGWLESMAARLNHRELLQQVWCEELKKSKGELHLEKEDYQMLESLGSSLQGAQLENCLGQISQVQDYFHSQQQMLEQVITEQGRMYRSIGVLAGILVMVVLA
ncbi:MAG: stage III sporulation protein AB [Firmicutes bacterium]|nr:stage III sporulation protein AB [Bacillota bacterium]